MKQWNKYISLAFLGFFVVGCQMLGSGKSTKPTEMVKPQVANLQSEATLSAPAWSVGDTWKFSDGYTLSVTEVLTDGRTMFQRGDNPHWFTRRGFFREESQSKRVKRLVVYRAPDPLKLFPAKNTKPVSFIREYMRNDTLVRHRTSWQIEGRERITVPAGTFDTWVLVWRSDGLDSNWRGYERWYYSPAVRNYVRLEYKYGEAPDGSRVLMSYTVK